MKELTLIDYLNIFKRRKNYFIVTFTVTAIAAAALAVSWSNYRSIATIEIEQPQVASDTTTPIGMGSGDATETLADLRISRIQQEVTSPGSLAEVISKFNLYPGNRENEPIAAVATTMAKKVKLTLIPGVIANPAANSKISIDQLSATAFTLSFDYGDPQIAQEVNNELVTRFLDEDLKERHAQAESTSEFLESQIKAMEASMAEQEKKIADFQSEHGISTPETLAFNQQASASAMMNMQSLDSQIAANEGTQGSIRAQMAGVDPYTRVIADGQVMTTPATQLKALEAQYTTLTAQYGPQHPDVLKVGHQIDALRAQIGSKSGKNSPDAATLKTQIKDVETNLEAAKKTYGPDNPDVISLQNQLHKLQDKQKTASESQIADNLGLVKDADNPAYLSFAAQLAATMEQHKALQEQRAGLAGQLAKYEEAVNKNPELEQQMATLSRDYDNEQLRYRELKEKKMSADMDVQMVTDRKGQRLIVINPPDLPSKTHPQRLLLLLGGIVFSFMAGIGAVILSQLLNQSILGAQHVTALLGVAPLATIPHIATNEERRMKHFRLGKAKAAVILLMIAAGISLAMLGSGMAHHLGLS